MKKMISILLAAIMILILSACGAKPQKKTIEDITDEDIMAAAEMLTGETDDIPTETEEVQKVYRQGETIIMMDDMIALTVDSFQFCKDADAVVGTNFEWYKRSVNELKDDKTALLIEATVEYKGNLKSRFNWATTKYSTVYADYNDGYEFRGGIDYPVDIGHGEGAARFEPLSNKKTWTCIMFIEVPDVVATDTASPLLLKFTAEGWSDDGANNYYEPTVIQLR